MKTKIRRKTLLTVLSILMMLSMLIGVMPMTVFAEEETCAHTNAVYLDEFGNVEASCFEPGVRGYYYCEDCGMYLDEDKENEYLEPLPAAKIPATGHFFNTDTGECDECGLANPVYTKVTSLDDVNEEDLYIIVAEADGQYFVLGGLYDRYSDEQGNIWCPDGATNAIPVTANDDGSISLVNQEVLEDGSPSEFMLDLYPEQFPDMSELGLTNVMLKLPNHCVYPFQTRYIYDNPDYDDTGYMGVSRYATEYGMWDSSEWIIDFYTTEVTDDTYRYEDEFGSKTHAEQVADGNIGENISEGDLLLYKASFYSVGGAMHTLRLREYNDQYYFICGEDWCLAGVGDQYYDENTNMWRQYTNDTQYAVSLYRYDVPTVNTHTCDFGDWVDDDVTETHTRTCKDTTCGKTETLPHNWDAGVQSGTANCLTGVTTTYTCTDNCGATKSETAEGLGHDWNNWTDDGENSPTDTHSHTCKRDCGVTAETQNHTWSNWVKEDATNHKKTCSVCNGTRVAAHTFGEWTPVGDGTIERRDCTEASCDAYETRTPHVCEFGDWMPDPDNDMKHIRKCECGESESGDHAYGEWTMKDENYHTHSCPTCGATEDFEHSFYDWIAKDDNDHIHDCMECEYASILPHDYVREVTKEPTDREVGEATYTCSLCSHSYTEELPKKIVQISGEVVGTVLNVPTGSNAYIPEGTVFDVVEQPVEQVPKQVLGEIAVTADGAPKALGMYDLSLLLEGAKIQPNGTVTITIPAPDLAAEYDSIIVVYIAPDGSYEECVTTVNDDGTITFETDHFSQYAVIGITKDRGLSVGAIVGIVIGSVTVAGTGGFALFWFVIKKKSFADLKGSVKKLFRKKKSLDSESDSTDNNA